MMFMRWFLLVILCISLVATASSGAVLDASQIKVTIDSTQDAKVDGKPISNLRLEQSFYPRDRRSQIRDSFSVAPDTGARDPLVFQFVKPNKQVTYSYSSEIRSTTDQPMIKGPHEFPITILPSSAYQYLGPSATIDSDHPEIKKVAKKLAANEDDLLLVLAKTASWVRNHVEYNLSTLTAEASQKSSWVLENKQGVCDEMTSLFIALLRAMGVPARFIKGVSYTDNELFNSNWEPHGWAEVLIPGAGWVPFDVTFGQFGFVDAGHIVFQVSNDPKAQSSTAVWNGEDSRVLIGAASPEVKVTSKLPGKPKKLDITVEAFEKNIGPESYLAIVATATNSEDRALLRELQIISAPEIDIIDDTPQAVAVLSDGTATASWIAKANIGADLSTTYTVPIVVFTDLNESGKTEVVVQRGNTNYNEKEVSTLAGLAKRSTSKLQISCTNSNSLIDCTVKNNRDSIEDVEVCTLNECKIINMAPMSSSDLGLRVPPLDAGTRTLPVIAKSKDDQSNDFITVENFDKPKVLIENIIVPEGVRYEKLFNVSFTLVRDSYSKPHNMKVGLKSHQVELFNVETLETRQDFIVTLEGKILDVPAVLEVSYEDEEGTTYRTTKELKVEIVDSAWYQDIFLWTRRMFRAVWS
jgi:transglutaminase-like putative cysteine protease